MGAIYFHTPCPPSPSPHPPSPPPSTSRNAIYINQPTKLSLPLIHPYIIIALPLTIQLLLQAIPSLKSTKEDLNHIHLPHIQKQASIPTHDPKAQKPSYLSTVPPPSIHPLHPKSTYFLPLTQPKSLHLTHPIYHQHAFTFFDPSTLKVFVFETVQR